MQQPTAAEGRKNLCNLLSYAEEILKVGERVVSDLARDAVVAFYEHEISGLEGVAAPVGDDCWLRVARLRETAPPDPDEVYRPWLAQPSGSGLFETPRLAEALLVSVTAEEASDLIEASLAMADDVMTPLGDGADRSGKVDVLLRLANMPEFAAGFAAWVAGPWTAWAESERPRRRSIAVYNRLFEVQQRTAAMGDDVPVEAALGVGIARWNHPEGKVNAPLIEAAVELELDPADGSLVVRPCEQAPRLALGPFDLLEVEGVGKLQREAAAQLERLYADPC